MGLILSDFSSIISAEIRSESIRIYPGDSDEEHLFGGYVEQYASYGRSDVVEFLLYKAQRLFMQGKTDEAIFYRDLANEINNKTWPVRPDVPSLEISKKALSDLMAFLSGPGAEHMEGWE